VAVIVCASLANLNGMPSRPATSRRGSTPMPGDRFHEESHAAAPTVRGPDAKSLAGAADARASGPSRAVSSSF
jgi:hypothetical protein